MFKHNIILDKIVKSIILLSKYNFGEDTENLRRCSMKKWTAILLILCIGISMIVLAGCEKQQQVQEEPEAISAEADTTAVTDSAAVEAMDMEEAAEEVAE